MFEVGASNLDWLSLTTWRDDLGRTFSDWAKQWGRAGKPTKRIQYAGFVSHDAEGSVFAGVGEQSGKDHYLLQVSGMASARAFRRFRDIIGNGAKCTRIDLQITADPGEGWSQPALYDRLRADLRGVVLNYVESFTRPGGGKLATIYVGSRRSDRLVRIYEKPGLGETVYLRFEIEYKGPTASQVAYDLLNGSTIDEILRWEVEKIGDVDLSNLVTPHLVGHPHRPIVIREKGNTEVWLIETVAPALKRFINDHNTDSYDVIEAILDAMRVAT